MNLPAARSLPSRPAGVASTGGSHSQVVTSEITRSEIEAINIEEYRN